MKNNKWILYVLGLALLFIVATAAYEHLGKNYATEEVNTEENEEVEEDANLAPDFTVYDLEGNDVDLSDFRGKPVVLNFWASWCGPCKGEMPDFQKIYEEYKDEVVFMMVNLTDGSQETVETASAFIESTGYTFPVYYDNDLEAAYAYVVNSVPRTYFITADGQLVAQAKTAIGEDVLLKGISKILTE